MQKEMKSFFNSYYAELTFPNEEQALNQGITALNDDLFLENQQIFMTMMYTFMDKLKIELVKFIPSVPIPVTAIKKLAF